jgi:Icc-related predicted phosphoesterase
LRADTEKPGKTVRIVCISDTHELHRELDIPPGDILIHAGDFTFMSGRPSKVADFDRWLGELPVPTKIVIPGNHDFLVEAGAVKRLMNATLLINRGMESHGLNIWGSPLTSLYGGAFGRSDPEARRRIYAEIPPEIDILITHGPPYGILDCEHLSSEHQGCPVLLDVVTRLKPRLHVFGHVHGGYGTVTVGQTIFANGAMLSEDCDVNRRPLQFALKVSAG